MTKRLIVGDEVFDYPDTGDINYGENATGWANEITKIAAEVRNAGDIAPTEVTLTGTSNGTRTSGLVNNMVFDLAFVQRIEVKGFITRTFTDATPTKVEDFVIRGSYNGSIVTFNTEFSGGEDNDVELDFTISGGQFGFSYLDIANTNTVKIKFQAKTLIDEEFFT